MDALERYKIERSIEDVIAILDSAPIRPDLQWEANVVQLTNCAPIAHHSIERELKALIAEAGGNEEDTHDLNNRHKELARSDGKSADFLVRAFDDAVKFYRYKVNTKGFRHFQSIEKYLTKIGNKKAFNDLRFWAIGESPKDQHLMRSLSMAIHRELLCALLCLFQDRHEVVSGRVESEVHQAMFDERLISYSTDISGKEYHPDWYIHWLSCEHTTCCSALEEAVDQNFAISEDQFVNQTLRDAYDDLQQSKDPAVRYYIRKLKDMPEGSEQRNPDAVPDVEWFSQERNSGGVLTPAGTPLAARPRII